MSQLEGTANFGFLIDISFFTFHLKIFPQLLLVPTCRIISFCSLFYLLALGLFLTLVFVLGVPYLVSLLPVSNSGVQVWRLEGITLSVGLPPFGEASRESFVGTALHPVNPMLALFFWSCLVRSSQIIISVSPSPFFWETFSLEATLLP